MGKSFDHEELGIDLDRVAAIPECHACRKKSDGHIVTRDGTVLCGKHFDEWAHRRAFGDSITPAEFARELREGRYKPCWEAKLEG